MLLHRLLDTTIIISKLCSFLAFDTCIGDFVFVMDSSASIGSRNWVIVKQFLIDTVRAIMLHPNETKVGVVVYSTIAEMDFTPDTFDNLEDIVDAVWDEHYMAGITNTADGIQLGREMMEETLKRVGVAQILIIFTDGISNVDANRTTIEADKARDAGILVYVIGKSSDVLSLKGVIYIRTICKFNINIQHIADH